MLGRQFEYKMNSFCDLHIIYIKNTPSALVSFGEITTNMHRKIVVLFLDYDSTLSPILIGESSKLSQRRMSHII